MDQEDRIALFLDYENLALGARDHRGGAASTSGPSPTRWPNEGGWWSVGRTPTGPTSTRTAGCSPGRTSS
ncbi:hypothetical protein NKG94_20620 [Micromonospora sp. M12]